MRLSFTKMQGAGNDFVVLDETQQRFHLTAAQYRWLADRHFGVGADQILTVRPAPHVGVDFEYVIHNADGGEVEHCGNGARCFVRFVRQKGLTDKQTVRVTVQKGEIELTEQADGEVTVNMGAPVFSPPEVPFDPAGLQALPSLEQAQWTLWQLPLPADLRSAAHADAVPVGVVSMGNPHAVWRVASTDDAPVASVGPWLERHPAFPKRVNVGFMQVLDRGHIKLRVFERGSGETLACGTGACAAVVAGIRAGWLDDTVRVQALGGALTVQWQGLTQHPPQLTAPVLMTGPATVVFEGSVDVPDLV